jgi:hypothetical protein
VIRDALCCLTIHLAPRKDYAGLAAPYWARSFVYETPPGVAYRLTRQASIALSPAVGDWR